MKLIVGLGNPGKEYENTRHNVGFVTIDNILKAFDLKCGKEKFGGLFYETSLNNEKVIFLKPQKYINLSGQVIKKYIDFFKIDLSDLFVIHDDLDMDTGTFKLREKGGSGGHNGLKDIELQLKTNEYKRMKIGISNNKQIDTKDYVLGKFSKEEQKKIYETILLGPNIINDFLTMSFSNLMNKYNK